MLTDTIFLTNLFHKKYGISKYKTMVTALMFASFVIFVLFNNIYTILTLTLARVLILLLFTEKAKSVGYFSISFMTLAFLEMLCMETLFFSYYGKFLLLLIIKIVFITIIYKEIGKYYFNFEFKMITQKMLYILFCFLCLLLGIYFYSQRR